MPRRISQASKADRPTPLFLAEKALSQSSCSLGQADVAEEVPEHRLGGRVGHVGAGPQRQQVAAVVVQDRQRDDAPAFDLQRPLEVELPELIGGVALEPPGRCRHGPDVGGDAAVAAEDGGDGAYRRGGPPLAGQDGVELAGSPTPAVAGLRHDPLDVLGRAGGAAARAPRAIGQEAVGSGIEAAEPLVGRLAADARAAGGLGDREAGGADGMDQGDSLFGHGLDLPGHGAPPFGGPAYPLGVLPMSLHYLLPVSLHCTSATRAWRSWLTGCGQPVAPDPDSSYMNLP
jgi:hypothetical protein